MNTAPGKALWGRFFFALAAAALAGSGLALATLRPVDVTLVKAGHLLDPVSGQVLRDQAVVVEDGKIVAVEPLAHYSPPRGAHIIDLSDAWVAPGLIDTHVHLTADPTIAPYEAYHISVAREAVLGAANARRTLLAGFTTVRNVGAGGYSDLALRDGVERGDIAGPRIFGAGPAIGITGGHCDDNNLAPEYRFSGEGVADGPDEVRKAVRRNVKYGVDLIKYCGTGGVFSKGDTPGGPQYSQGEADIIVAEAHALGRRVAVHAHGALGIKIAIRAGVDTVEHASLIDDEGLAMAKAAGTILSMDIYNTDYTQSEGKENGVPEEFLKKDRDIGEIQRQNFKKAHDAGVKLSFGTDAGIYPHGDNAKQFAVMVAYGQSPMEALRSATVIGAQALGRERELGAIAPGFAADLIAVANDPLADIRAFEKPVFVMKAGAVYRGLPAQCAAAPAAWACEPPAK